MTILQWALARSAQTSMSLANQAENQDNQILLLLIGNKQKPLVWKQELRQEHSRSAVSEHGNTFSRELTQQIKVNKTINAAM